MNEQLRFLPAGDNAVIVELIDLASTLALFEELRDTCPKEVLEIVPASQTLLVYFDPLLTSLSEVADFIASVAGKSKRARAGTMLEIPVMYDGEDLDELAGILGWSKDELIQRHTQATFTVAFAGFAPGFVYMICDDPAFNVPRRANPRTRIPAGSVALAGQFGGIYPSDSPGGWQLLGTTTVKMWDLNRTRPALLAPGDQVRFKAIATAHPLAGAAPSTSDIQKIEAASGLTVTRADHPALYQDLGRYGKTDQGVSYSGAVDRLSLSEANLCVGNSPGATAIEIAYGGFSLKVDRAVTLAVTGALSAVKIKSADGRSLDAPFNHPFALDAGDEITVDHPKDGTRSYLALRGGFAVAPVLGSSATDTLAKLGPAPITAGHVLVPSEGNALPVAPDRPMRKPLPKSGESITIDVVLGPRTDWFTQQAVETFLEQEWQVTTESNRVGMRLSGLVKLERSKTSELPSEGTPLGAIQVPPNGQPILFLSDHPLTGGYPVIAVVARHHLDVVGQIPIGASIRFKSKGAFAPVIRQRNT